MAKKSKGGASISIKWTLFTILLMTLVLAPLSFHFRQAESSEPTLLYLRPEKRDNPLELEAPPKQEEPVHKEREFTRVKRSAKLVPLSFEKNASSEELLQFGYLDLEAKLKPKEVDLFNGLLREPSCAPQREGKEEEEEGKEAGQAGSRTDAAPHCPRFSPCRGDLSSVSFCTEKRFRYVLEEDDVVERYPAEILALSHVFVNYQGLMFDHKHVYETGGCRIEFEPLPQEALHPSRFTKFPIAINLMVAKPTRLFYVFSDLLPSLYLLRGVLSQYPLIPILTNIPASFFPYFRYLGIDERRLNFLADYVKKEYYVFSKLLYTPVWPGCRQPPRRLWKKLREDYITRHGRVLLGGQEIPDSLERPSVVIVDRLWSPDNYRAIPNLDEITRKLEAKFSLNITIFRSNEHDFSSTVRLFSRTNILIGPHGWELALMTFMPRKAGIVEVISENFARRAIQKLAKACGVDYQSTMVGGDWQRIENVVPSRIVAAVRASLASLKAR